MHSTEGFKQLITNITAHVTLSVTWAMVFQDTLLCYSTFLQKSHAWQRLEEQRRLGEAPLYSIAVSFEQHHWVLELALSIRLFLL